MGESESATGGTFESGTERDGPGGRCSLAKTAPRGVLASEPVRVVEVTGGD